MKEVATHCPYCALQCGMMLRERPGGVGEVGDPGVVTMYAAPDAGPVIADLMASEMGAQSASSGGSYDSEDGSTESTVPTPEPEVPDELLKAFEDFGGAAAAIRFADGGVELEFAGDFPESSMMMVPTDQGATADLVGTLPDDTAFAYGLALPDGWAQQLIESLPDYGIPQEEIDRGLAQAEAQTGLSLPEDLETLLGDQVALAFGGSFDLEQLMNSGDRARKGAADRRIPRSRAKFARH